MRLEYSLELRQTQKLLMTPQLRQALELLQLPALELIAYLDQQYLENPMLELEEGEEEPVANGEEDELFDIDWELYFQDRSDVGEPPNREAGRRETFEQFVAARSTLSQRLLQQLRLLPLARDIADIAAYIIDNLDHCGYLHQPCCEIARQLRVGEDQVLAALAAVQGLEPAGVGARNLRECLLLQLSARDDVPPWAWEIVCRHLDWVARGRIPALAEVLGADIADVQRAVDYIKGLEPKPGLSLDQEVPPAYIFPDVTVLAAGGEWIIMINDGQGPRLRLNPLYYRLLRSADGEEAKKFLRDKFNSALWLLKSLEQRRTTLYRITEFILDYQRAFFAKGVKYLRPLRIKDVADALDIHESTVSRALSGKYIQTPRGIFEFKYFFSANLETADGSGASSTGVKKQLQELVEREDPSCPLTDQQLAETLQRMGIKISRRTVAKYREELQIPNSALRRRWA